MPRSMTLTQLRDRQERAQAQQEALAEQISKRIRAFCADKCMSGAYLAQMSGCSKTYACKVLRGTAPPTDEMVEFLVEQGA